MKKIIFWSLFVIISILTVLFSLKYFDKAYPIISLDLETDRHQVINRAITLAENLNWDIENYQATAVFKLDSKVRNYIELELGGADSFKKMIYDKLYYPYTWRVRFFREYETEEFLVIYTPDGSLYGFLDKKAEDEEGAIISSDSAIYIALTLSEKYWNVHLTKYKLIELSEKEQPGGRLDHTFIFEHSKRDIGDARYRLRVVVSGNQLTELRHFIKIPESFSLRYKEMRSANTTISNISTLSVVLFYILGGCILGCVYLIKKKYLIWKKPLIWGFFVSFLFVILRFNQFPLLWIDYDTAISSTGFVINNIVLIIITFIGSGLLFSTVFMIAESLTRKAFPNHIQFWKIWKSDVASSPEILSRTFTGYLIVPLFVAFDIALYIFTTRTLGWWTPSDILINPNILATVFPWISPIAISLQAGFLEECLFRAIPIAGAAIIGKKFGKEKLFIFIALIIQAFIFGAAHANYPQQPAYARVIELIIPSLSFGLLYIYFGLLPAIIMHFIVDVVYISIPIFVSTAQATIVSKIIVIILSLIPFYIIIISFIRKRKFKNIDRKYFNFSWVPKKAKISEQLKEDVVRAPKFSLKFIIPLLISAVLVLALWILSSDFKTLIPGPEIDKYSAKHLAMNNLTAHNLDSLKNWSILCCIDDKITQQDRFIWQEGREKLYRELLGSYLAPPAWKIRFVRFDGPVSERAEEIRIIVFKKDTIFRFTHKLPENRDGAELSSEQAMDLAFIAISEIYNLNPELLKEISAKPVDLPNRNDWIFTFEDTTGYPLEFGAKRIDIKISGNIVVDTRRYIHVPEEWARNERNLNNISGIIKTIATTFFISLLVTGFILSIINWNRKKYSTKAFAVISLIILIINIFVFINRWQCTISKFSTAVPFINQVFTSIAFFSISTIFVSLSFGLLSGFVLKLKSVQDQINGNKSIFTGVAIGIIITGISTFIISIFPSLKPYSPDFTYLGSFFPVLSIITRPLIQYILSVVFILFIFKSINVLSQGFRKKRILSIFLLILISIVISGVNLTSSVISWISSGLIIGIIIVLLYIFYIRYQISSIPIIIGTMTILNELKIILLDSNLITNFGFIISTMIIMIFSFFLMKKLQK